MVAGCIIETCEPQVADPCVRGPHSGDCTIFCFILTLCILVEFLRLHPPLSGYATFTVRATEFSEISLRCYVHAQAALYPMHTLSPATAANRLNDALSTRTDCIPHAAPTVRHILLPASTTPHLRCNLLTHSTPSKTLNCLYTHFFIYMYTSAQIPSPINSNTWRKLNILCTFSFLCKVLKKKRKDFKK